MPCYEINTMAIGFTVNEDLLIETLNFLNLKYYREGKVIVTNNNTISFDLKKETIRFPENLTSKANEIKREYSRKVIETVARKRKWILKQNGNKLTAKKY